MFFIEVTDFATKQPMLIRGDQIFSIFEEGTKTVITFVGGQREIVEDTLADLKETLGGVTE